MSVIPHSIEIGYNSTITIDNASISKLSPLGDGYTTYGEAAQVQESLHRYASELAGQPLSVVELLSSQIVAGETGYKLQHSYPLVDGPNMLRLPKNELHTAVAGTALQISAMDVLPGGDALAVPIDGQARNFHIDSDGARLVDMLPALSRKPDGTFCKDGATAWVMGTKTGALVRLLSTGINRGTTRKQKISYIVREYDAWCYDALPSTLDPAIKHSVRQQIRWHFAPYIVKMMTNKLAA